MSMEHEAQNTFANIQIQGQLHKLSFYLLTSFSFYRAMNRDQFP